MAVGLYTQYYPNSHFFAMHKTYGTLCKNQEEQDWCYMQEEKSNCCLTLGRLPTSHLNKMSCDLRGVSLTALWNRGRLCKPKAERIKLYLIYIIYTSLSPMLRRSQPKPRNRLPLAILGKLSECRGEFYLIYIIKQKPQPFIRLRLLWFICYFLF